MLDVEIPGLPFPTHYKRFAFKMFTFVNRAMSHPGNTKKKITFDEEVVHPITENVRDHARYIHILLVSNVSILNVSLLTCKHEIVVFTRCSSTVTVLCALQLHRIVVWKAAPERVSSPALTLVMNILLLLSSLFFNWLFCFCHTLVSFWNTMIHCDAKKLGMIIELNWFLFNFLQRETLAQQRRCSDPTKL